MIKIVSFSPPVLTLVLIAIVSIVVTLMGFLALELMFLLAGFGLVAFLYSYFVQKNEGVKAFLIWFFVVLIGLAIGLYRSDNFIYPVFNVDHLHKNGLPFSLYLNTAKTLAGYIAIAFLIALPAIGAPLITRPYVKYFTMLLLPVCVISIAYPMLGLSFYSKELTYIAIFGLVNLLTTCVSEEAFMRLIFHREIGRFVNGYSNNRWIVEGIPLALSSLLFTITHIGPSPEVTLVYSLAGFFYGLIYVLTKNIWYSIGCHFLVNIIHFSFFTYPIF